MIIKNLSIGLLFILSCQPVKKDNNTIVSENTKQDNDTVIFQYEKFNSNPITEYYKEDIGFDIVDGKASYYDSTFVKNNPDIYQIFKNKIIVPSDSISEVFDFNLQRMKNYTFFNNSSREDKGICCLGVFATYKFSFSGNNFIALYTSEYGHNYNPDRSIFDPILLLYKVKDANTFEILMCSRQGDVEFQSLGDLDKNGKLDFIKSSNATTISKICSYELDDTTGSFKRTGKYLQCVYKDVDGVFVINSQSNWYK